MAVRRALLAYALLSSHRDLAAFCVHRSSSCSVDSQGPDDCNPTLQEDSVCGDEFDTKVDVNTWLSEAEIIQLLEKELPQVVMTGGSADIEVVSSPPKLAAFLHLALSVASSLSDAYMLPTDTFMSPETRSGKMVPSDDARVWELLKSVERARDDELKLSECEDLLKLLAADSISAARRTHLFASDSHARFL